MLRFVIRDTGIGISGEAQSRLFQSFSQADTSTTRRFGGTGLGLAVSKQLVALMGGEIGLRSQLDQGSEFWFTMHAPIIAQHAPDSKSVADAIGGELAELSHSPDSGSSLRPDLHLTLCGVRVLIVEDNATNREILLRQVSATGASCEIAVDGVAGLAALHAAQGRSCGFHLALIDMKMPRMNGIELVRTVRADPVLRDIKLIMLTSVSGNGEVAAARAAGGNAYLTKPICRAELKNALTSLVGQQAGDLPDHDTLRVADFDARGAWVLLAEDNRINEEIARTLLEAVGCRVVVATNGRSALELLATQPFALVLMDRQMPEMDGFEATRRIRALETASGAHTPIVALTANAMDGDRECCLAAGMDDYLAKPFSRADLNAVLRRWIFPAGQTSTSEQTLSSTWQHPAVAGQRAAAVHNSAAPAVTEPSLPAFDPTAFERSLPANMGIDSALGRRMLGLFVSGSTKLLDEIDRTASKGDAPALFMAAHSLKSSSATVGALALSAMAAELEALARAGQVDAPSSQHANAAVGHPARLRQAFARVRNQLCDLALVERTAEQHNAA